MTAAEEPAAKSVEPFRLHARQNPEAPTTADLQTRINDKGTTWTT